jgi:hypothetical protein
MEIDNAQTEEILSKQIQESLEDLLGQLQMNKINSVITLDTLQSIVDYYKGGNRGN